MKKNNKRIPVGNCTLSDLADKLLSLEPNTELNFSKNADGSDYYGAKRLTLFDCDLLMWGYYGHSYLYTFDYSIGERSEIIEELKKEFDSDEVYLFNQEQSQTQEENASLEIYTYLSKIWCKNECKIVFGNMWQHFWSKWTGFINTKSEEKAIIDFCGELTSHNWSKIVNRVKLLNSRDIYILVANEYCDVEDIEKVLKGDKEAYTNLLLAKKIELYVLSEFIEAFNAEKINTSVHTLYTLDTDTREILRLK